MRSQPGLGVVLGHECWPSSATTHTATTPLSAARAFAGANGAIHHQALWALGNRLVGVLDGCLTRRVAYQEQAAWPVAEPATLSTGRGMPGLHPPAMLAT